MNDRSLAARGYFWTTLEVAVLREHYVQPDGPALCAQLLPHRGQHAVYAKARSLGLRAPNIGTTTGKRFARKYPVTPEIDRLITTAYTQLRGRGAVKRLALEVGRPKWWVCKRAATLGLGRARLKEPAWSRAEVAIAEEWASCTNASIRRKLAQAGFARTDAAIGVKLKRLQLDRTDPDVWSARDLGSLLGVDGKTVADWVARRGLKAQREAWGPNGVLRITRRALRDWLKTHHAYVDLRKVDQPWFWELLLGRP